MAEGLNREQRAELEAARKEIADRREGFADLAAELEALAAVLRTGPELQADWESDYLAIQVQLIPTCVQSLRDALATEWLFIRPRGDAG